jgi:hypothetical protein
LPPLVMAGLLPKKDPAAHHTDQHQPNGPSSGTESEAWLTWILN